MYIQLNNGRDRKDPECEQRVSGPIVGDINMVYIHGSLFLSDPITYDEHEIVMEEGDVVIGDFLFGDIVFFEKSELTSEEVENALPLQQFKQINK